eukprot:42322-Pyramimonas_sp.AAC.1
MPTIWLKRNVLGRATRRWLSTLRFSSHSEHRNLFRAHRTRCRFTPPARKTRQNFLESGWPMLTCSLYMSRFSSSLGSGSGKVSAPGPL